MKLLRFILIFSLIVNLGTQAAISCDMKACKISKKATSCCKKEVLKQTECCCTKMKCKIATKYNDALPSVTHMTIQIQFEYLPMQDVVAIMNEAILSRFLATYSHWANPPSKINIPLLT